ncbi:MAG TPA: site-specific integrase [Acetobacteraceae bacterium]|nr:site-specific integrase [Acetobacteraceae bacterium]
MTTIPATPAPAAGAAPPLIPPVPERPPSAYERALAAARKFSAAALAASTRRGYRADWQAFTDWCAGLEERPSALPAAPETVAAFLSRESFERNLGFATVKRRASGIARAHAAAGLPAPTRAKLVVDTLRGIRNERALPPRKKKAATEDLLRAMIARTADDLRGCRDRAILLGGFGGAFRRSELAALEVAWLAWTPKGVVATLPRSKGDPEGEGQSVPLLRTGGPLCPVAALEAWLARSGITRGPVFRAIFRTTRTDVSERLASRALDGGSVARIVQRYARLAGENAAEFGGHSLRRGPLTAAARRRASIWKMQELGRYRSLDVLLDYVEPADDLFEGHALDGIV